MPGLVAAREASADTPPDRKRDGDGGCPSHHFEGKDSERRGERGKRGVSRLCPSVLLQPSLFLLLLPPSLSL